MTWLKLGDEHADQCARVGLSDAAFRTHVESLLWTMRRETGGFLDIRDVRRAVETAEPMVAIAELLAAGFWQQDEGGWQIVQGMKWQPEPVVIARRREDSNLRQKRRRLHDVGIHTECLEGRCPNVTA